MWDKIRSVVTDVIKPVTNLVDNLHTSKEEKMQIEATLQKAQLDMAAKMIDVHQKELEAQKEIIIAEAKGGWLQRNWRPILMLAIVTIVVNNYLVYPYLSLFTSKALVLELPDKLWNLMMIGVGGYIAGRSGEKITETLKKKG